MINKRITINLSEDDLASLRDVAKANGFILDRSQKMGEGSVRQMLLALARHTHKVVQVCSVDGCDNQVAIKSTANVCWNHLHDIFNDVKFRQYRTWKDEAH